MRVELNFGGDPSGAISASEAVEQMLKSVFRQAEETGVALNEVKITTGQATETAANARRMQDSISGVGREARQARRDIEQLKLAVAGSGGGLFGGLLPGGASARSGTYLAGGILAAAGLGPVGEAGLAGLAALPGLAFTGASAVGVLVTAFHGLGDAIGGDRQAFEALSPTAQKFTQDLRSLHPWLKSVQDTAREGLLPGVDEALHSALTGANAAAIKEGVGGIATALGDVAEQWGKSIGSPEFTAGIHDLLAASAVETRDLGDAAGHLAGALGKVAVAAIPLTEWMTREIDVGARLVDQWVAAERASGGLASGLDHAKSELEIVAHLGEALLKVVFDLAAALEPLGNEILVGLTHELQHLDDWLKRNREEIGNELVSALHTAEHAAHLAEDAFHLLGDMLGSDKTAAELLIGALIGFKVGWKFTGLIAELGLIGTAAGEAGAAGKVSLLLGRLNLLKTLGPIAVAIVVTEILKKISGDSTGQGFPNVPGYSSIPMTPGDQYPLVHALQKKMSYTDSGPLEDKYGDFSDKKITAAEFEQWLENHPGAWKGAHGVDLSTIPISKEPAAPQGPAGPTGDPAGLAYPLATLGKTIGTPYAGTHGKAFNIAGGSDNWESENAIDIAVKVGTPVTAVESGVIGPATEFGALSSSSSRMAGLRLHLIGDSGNEYYYAHLSSISVKPGQRVSKGDVLGMSGSANGVAHLHFAQRSGNPMTFTGAPVPTATPPAAGGSAPPGLVGEPTDASIVTGTPQPWKPGAFGTDFAPLQLALTQSTPLYPGATVKTQIATLHTAIQWLEAHLADYTGTDLQAASDELASLIGQLQSAEDLTRTKLPLLEGQLKMSPDLFRAMSVLPHVSGSFSLSSPGSRLSAQNSAQALLKLLGTDPLASATSPAASVADAEKSLRELRSKLGPEIRAIKKDLNDPYITASNLSVLRAQMAQYKTTIAAGVEAARQAVAAEKASFGEAFRALGESALQALQDEAANFKSPSQVVLEQLQQAHDDQQLQEALDQANTDLANALVPVPDSNQIVENIKTIIGQYSQANLIDQVQSAILGGTSTGIDSTSLLKRLQDAVNVAGQPDPDKVKQAEKAVADAKYQIQVAGLQKQAKAETDAFNDQISEQERAIRLFNSNWETYFTLLKGNIGGISGEWAKLLAQIGVPQDVIDKLKASAAQTIKDAAGVDVPGSPGTIGGLGGAVGAAGSLQDVVGSAVGGAAGSIMDAIGGLFGGGGGTQNGTNQAGEVDTGWISANMQPGPVIDFSQYGLVPLGPGSIELFAEGGVATGPDTGRDSVNARLTPGERVLTSQQTAMLEQLLANGAGGDTYVEVTGNMPAEWFSVQMRKNRRELNRMLGENVSERLRSGRY